MKPLTEAIWILLDAAREVDDERGSVLNKAGWTLLSAARHLSDQRPETAL